MGIAILATVIVTASTARAIDCQGNGIGAIGALLAKRVEMTQTLVAILHSFCRLAVNLVGFATYLDPESHLQGTENYLGDDIGTTASTHLFTGAPASTAPACGKPISPVACLCR
jgi:NAD(P) transhydrogenase subunit beta